MDCLCGSPSPLRSRISERGDRTCWSRAQSYSRNAIVTHQPAGHGWSSFR